MLVELRVSEQRYRAVWEVLEGASVTEVARRFGVLGVLIGAGSGAVFKGTTGIVLEASAPEDRLTMTSALLVVLYVGLSARCSIRGTGRRPALTAAR